MTIVMAEREIESATLVLLGACGEQGEFGRVIRDESSGELQIVYAVRGRSAKRFLELVTEQRQEGWAQRLLRSFGSLPDER